VLIAKFRYQTLSPRHGDCSLNRFCFQTGREREREMGGADHGEGVTYKGMTLHKPKRWHTVTGKGLCAVMWFWVLYRAKQDGPVVLGWRHPWEGHDDHGHGHDH
ncbi:NADH dehydrogenase [ubiquinone] 1 beta subcomplex subunit 2-like, partial [Melia azedarach]